jgi:hypothetical protein
MQEQLRRQRFVPGYMDVFAPVPKLSCGGRPADDEVGKQVSSSAPSLSPSSLFCIEVGAIALYPYRSFQVYDPGRQSTRHAFI